METVFEREIPLVHNGVLETMSLEIIHVRGAVRVAVQVWLLLGAPGREILRRRRLVKCSHRQSIRGRAIGKGLCAARECGSAVNNVTGVKARVAGRIHSPPSATERGRIGQTKLRAKARRNVTPLRIPQIAGVRSCSGESKGPIGGQRIRNPGGNEALGVRVNYTQIHIVDMVVPFRRPGLLLIAQTQVKGQPVGCFPVVLSVKGQVFRGQRRLQRRARVKPPAHGAYRGVPPQ